MPNKWRPRRFWTKVAIGDSAECWLWVAGKTGAGYGAYQHEGRLQLAHRVSWQLAHRRPVPEGKLVLHQCDTPLCVNPNHLWLGSQSDNIRDAAAKGRHHNTRKTHCKNGHPFDEQNTVRYGRTRWCRLCRLQWQRERIR